MAVDRFLDTFAEALPIDGRSPKGTHRSRTSRYGSPMTTQTWVLVGLMFAVYLTGVASGAIVSRRRTRDRVMREMLADPAHLRVLATRIEDARFRAAEADAARRVGGLGAREM